MIKYKKKIIIGTSLVIIVGMGIAYTNSTPGKEFIKYKINKIYYSQFEDKEYKNNFKETLYKNYKILHNEEVEIALPLLFSYLDKIEVKSNEVFFLRDNQLVFPVAAKEKLVKKADGWALDIYVFSPRPLDDLLIEPNMPKLTLVVKAKECQLAINDKAYVAASQNRHEATYKELPLLQGWNKVSIKIGERDKNEFSGNFRCDNRNEFLSSLKVMFVNPEVK